MSLQRLLKIFYPKDKIFFTLFQQVATNLENMGQAVEKVFYESDKEKREAIYTHIKMLEQQTDSLTHRVFIQLSKNFITPFDREDIHKLANTLDDVADNINGCTKRMRLYDLDLTEKQLQHFSALVREATGEIKKLMFELPRLSKTASLNESIIQINSLENEGDDIFNESLRRLFVEEKDTRLLIQKREIYQILESTIDKCEDVANVVESIILKYA